MLVLLQEKEVSIEGIQNACERVDGAIETVMDTMVCLTDKYREIKDRDNINKICLEIETVETKYSAAQSQAQEVLTEMNRVANLNKFVRQTEHTQSRDASELLMSHGQQNSVRLKDVSVHQPIVSSKENATQAYQPAATVYPAIPSQRGPE